MALNESELGPLKVFEFKPKENGTLKQGRSPRNVERWLERKKAKLEARGSQRLSGNNGERRAR